MKHSYAAALAAGLLIISASGCSNHHTAIADAAPVADDRAPAVLDSSDEKTGAGHLSLTGDSTLEKDFAISDCQVGPPGDGLLSGYHMMSKDGAKPIALLSVTLKDYSKDGAYVQQALSGETASQTIATGSASGLTLMILRDAAAPLAFGQAAQSKLTITVSENGSKGDAEFTDLASQPLMENFDPKSGHMPAGARVSGSVTWTCGAVGHLNAKMNDAVNGMFKRLIPTQDESPAP